MTPKEERAAVFQDTVKAYTEDRTLADAVKRTVEKTVLYEADDYPPLPEAAEERDCSIRVTKHRSFEAAMELRAEFPDARIAVHNFASATRPGGGVESGAGAQEECLCRCSTLYPALAAKTLRDRYYGVNRAAHNALNTDACIVTPDVVIFKTDTAVPVRMQREQWVTVDVLTCAAPNLRRRPSNRYNPQRAEPVKLTEEEQYEIHLKRAKHLLQVAAHSGEECLVLGAFGCGAFENSPRAVARAYRDALPAYRKYFRAVEFAVYCSPTKTENYRIFAETFQVPVKA